MLLTDEEREKVREKIQKLFSLSQSDNPNEASIALQKATDLMKNYGLSKGDALLTEKIIYRGNGRIHGWINALASEVAWLNNCVAVNNKYMIKMYGKDLNVMLSEEMFKYLYDTIRRLVEKEKGTGKGKKFISEYKIIIVTRLSERMKELGAQVSWAPDREKEVEFVRKNFKKPVRVQALNITLGLQNIEAIRKGIAVADGISLNKQTTDIGSTKFLTS
jgi:hypothetical protein